MARLEWISDTAVRLTDAELIKVCREAVRMIAKSARKSADYKDKTRTLRRSIRIRKSRYKGGGYIVKATAPHAHLVELGHGGPHPAGPHPFMRNAVEQHRREIEDMFREAFKPDKVL